MSAAEASTILASGAAPEVKHGDVFKLLAEVQRDVGVVGKEKKGQGLGYAFRSIDAVYDAVHGALAKHGVICTPTDLDLQRNVREYKKDGRVRFWTTVVLYRRYAFFAPDGSYLSFCQYSEGADTGDKAINKAKSNGIKYAYFELLSIPLSSDHHQPDSDREQEPPTFEVDPPPAPVSRVGNDGRTVDEYLVRIGEMATIFEARNWARKHLDSIRRDFPVSEYERVRVALENKRDELNKLQAEEERRAELVEASTEFGRAIKAFRDEYGVSMKDVAGMIGIGVPTLAKVVSGQPVSTETNEKVGEWLNRRTQGQTGS